MYIHTHTHTHSPWGCKESGMTEQLTLHTHTEVGSLSLLQGIFLTQELNQGLLNCRWILYQLRNQGSIYRYRYIK